MDGNAYMGSLTPDSKGIVVSNGRNEVCLYEIATGTVTKELIQPSCLEKTWSRCSQISPHDSNLLISGSRRGKFIVYDMEKLQ